MYGHIVFSEPCYHESALAHGVIELLGGGWCLGAIPFLSSVPVGDAGGKRGQKIHSLILLDALFLLS